MYETFDHQESDQERVLSAEEVKMRDDMQRTLMYDYIRACGLAPDDDITPVLIGWVEKYAPEFDRVLKKLESEDPDLISHWQEHPDNLMDVIRARMSPAARGEEAGRMAA